MEVLGLSTLNQIPETRTFQGAAMLSKFWILAGVVVVCAAASPASQDAPSVSAERKTEGEIRVPSRFDGIVHEMDNAIRPGKKIRKGDVLAVLDLRLAMNLLHIAEAKVKAAEADRDATRHTVGETEIRMKVYADQAKAKTYSEMEARGAKLLHEHKLAELRKAEEMLKIAELEREQAKLHLAMHAIHSPIDGVIRQVLKRPGEAVRGLETVIVVETTKDK